MIALLTFLIQFCAKLLEHPGFKFVDSEIGRNPAEGSSILLESRDVQIFMSNEGEQITWWIRSMYDSRENNWFLFDLVVRWLGLGTVTGVMDAPNSKLLSRELGRIIIGFRKDVVDETIAKLNKLKMERSRHM